MNALFLLNAELALPQEAVQTFAREKSAPRAAAIDRDCEFPRELFEETP